jgi:4-amino-4-deoxy-L-arabinose transferase-like glycosyltransferase
MNTSNSSRFGYHHVLALLLVLFSFFMTALVSDRVFEHVPHLEDEVAYLFEAKLLTHGQTVIPSPTPSRPFWQPFVIDYGGKRFGKYPLGWPGTLALGVAAGQPWMVNALLGALTVALIFRLGSEVFNADTGLIAAALTAFSPMALLLNATLMGHTAALFTSMLFMYAYWRIEKGNYRIRWGVVAGLALGMTLINRPLAGVAVAAPFIGWSGLRLLQAYLLDRKQRQMAKATELRTSPPNPLSVYSEGEQSTGTSEGKSDTSSWMKTYSGLVTTLSPLILLGILTLILISIIPAYQYAATGDSRENLYLLVWSYDRIGFGPGYGAHGHTIEKGIRQTRWDLSMTASDLFGWQTGSMFTAGNQLDPKLEDHLLNQGDYWPPQAAFPVTLPGGNTVDIPFIGLSWVLLPFGLLIGFKRKWLWWAVWLIFGGLLVIETTGLPSNLISDPTFSFVWMGGYVVWMMIPFVFLLIMKPDRQITWTWLLLAFILSLIGLHLTYWIGSQRYSTRYYFEALGAFAILSAVPLAWLMKRIGRLPVYIVFVAVLVYSLYAYSQPRIDVLYRFNWISPQLVQAVENRRQNDLPVVVVVSGSDVRWRAYGSLTVKSSPYLDSDIVVAWDTGGDGVRDSILKLFPGRQVIDMQAVANKACFVDDPSECYGEGVDVNQ